MYRGTVWGEIISKEVYNFIKFPDLDTNFFGLLDEKILPVLSKPPSTCRENNFLVNIFVGEKTNVFLIFSEFDQSFFSDFNDSSVRSLKKPNI